MYGAYDINMIRGGNTGGSKAPIQNQPPPPIKLPPPGPADEHAACVASALIQLGPHHQCSHDPDFVLWPGSEGAGAGGTGSDEVAALATAPRKVLLAGLLYNMAPLMAHYTAQVGRVVTGERGGGMGVRVICIGVNP